MKKHLTTLLLLLAVSAFAQKGSKAGTAFGTFNANNVSVRINNCGDLGWDLKSTAKFEVPKNSGKSALFCNALWIGGFNKGNLHLAAMTYRQTGSDFYPGPIDSINGTTDSSDALKYDSVWMVRRGEIDSFRKGISVSQNILNWPGSAYDTSHHYTRHLAPFVDMNMDGIYNPNKNGGMTSDYPLIKGDQMLWWVFNDMGNKHDETNAKQMGIEVHGSAWGFDCPTDTALNHTLFVSYKIFNRSNKKYDNLYLGSFNDVDIGFGFDDLMGTDTLLNAVYGFNADDTDFSYGENPPVESVAFMDLPLTNSMGYYNDYTYHGNPESSYDYYNYLTSHNKDSSELRLYNAASHTTVKSKYYYPYDFSKYTTAQYDAYKKNVYKGDTRLLGASGPYALNPNDIKIMTLAFVYSRNPSGSNLKNITQMQKDVKHITDFYNNKIPAYCTGGTAIDAPQKNKSGIRVYPNPTRDVLNIETNNFKGGNFSVLLTDILGRNLIEKTTNSTQNISLDISNLPDGIYLVSVIADGLRENVKVVKK
ncbi:MAG: T9SS type A sorting domain-containing protein [Bacteroidetes bacterium]|nr:T9SS type A sorting domain-containing protein [Bacteroidota bacterium]